MLFVAIMIPFITIYSSVHYYIGLRFLQSFAPLIDTHVGLYWSGLTLLALSPFVARLAKYVSHGSATGFLANFGNYWLAVIYNAGLLWAGVDFVRFIAGIPAAPSLGVGIGVMMAVALILAYGLWNARLTRVTTYHININKPAEGLEDITAVMVSDLHLGTTVNNSRLAEMVDHINALEPDIVFFAGDIIDGDVSEFAKQEMPRLLRQLTPRLGSFAILGNHEHLGDNSAEATRHMSASGITVLVDQYTKVNNQFYVVGRNDRLGRYMAKNKAPRKELSAVMAGIDHNLPIILLDHQPAALHEALANKVDLQLSGHTHNGQFFPNHLITGRLFEIDWGHLTKETLQVIVSCGYGTWGPPIRTSGYSEIVEIHLKFIGTDK